MGNRGLMYRRAWCGPSLPGFLQPADHSRSSRGSAASAISPRLTMWPNQFNVFLSITSLFSPLPQSLMLIEEVIAMSSLAVVSFSPQGLSFSLKWWWLLLLKPRWAILLPLCVSAIVRGCACGLYHSNKCQYFCYHYQMHWRAACHRGKSAGPRIRYRVSCYKWKDWIAAREESHHWRAQKQQGSVINFN